MVLCRSACVLGFSPNTIWEWVLYSSRIIVIPTPKHTAYTHSLHHHPASQQFNFDMLLSERESVLVNSHYPPPFPFSLAWYYFRVSRHVSTFVCHQMLHRMCSSQSLFISASVYVMRMTFMLYGRDKIYYLTFLNNF